MALFNIEGFDHYSSVSNLMLGNGWSNTQGTHSLPTGRFGGACLRTSIGSGTATVQYTFPTATATFCVGFAFFVETSYASQSFLQFRSSTTAQVNLLLDATGHFVFQRNGTTLATGTTVLSLNAWHYIELAVTISDTVGTYELRIDGATEFSATGADTRNGTPTTVDNFLLQDSSSTAPFFNYDDFYMKDDLTFLGDCRVETLYVTTDSAVAWTPLSSTNASNVDETAADGDTSYNSTSSTATVDLFNHGSLSSTPVTIFGSKVSSYVRIDDANSYTFRNKLKSSTTTQNGTSAAPTSSYIFQSDMINVDPATSTAWTVSGINNSLIGYENV